MSYFNWKKQFLELELVKGSIAFYFISVCEKKKTFRKYDNTTMYKRMLELIPSDIRIDRCHPLTRLIKSVTV